jgi:phosphopentomutase
MTPFNRVLLIVIDSVGVGAAPDAAEYGDAGSDTLGNLARVRPLHLPNLTALGLANIKPMAGLPATASPSGAYGRCLPASPGKDTTTGHWEMAGIHLAKPFPLYPHGFPAEVIGEFERRIGRQSLANIPASGTEIIERLGAEHMATGRPIVYTSADSVFQVAAHEEVIPVAELHRICAIAREILTGPHEVGRVIARPFIGKPGAFTRTANRKDFAVAPPAGMLLDRLAERGVAVHSVGKIYEVFLGRGIRSYVKTKSNADGMARILESLGTLPRGLVFANLVDFDMLYGHRNDVEGYAAALEAVDAWVPQLIESMAPDDLVVFTADHGCDPTTPSTDHSREYVPVVAFGPRARKNVNLGVRATISDIGQTVAENFEIEIQKGVSFLSALL